ncbi:MAG: toll/interleukin-1 receptor domain-containing protein [Bacteroidota bacterium]|nr:toll/interleukin-1 receptor domain-containing protein [Bacteroidota bacterium]
MYNRIGICFSSEDRSIFLEDLIRKLRINQRAVFSEIEIPPPLYNSSTIRLRYSDFYAMIMIISRHNKDTVWVREGLRILRNQIYTDQHKVIPVIIEDCFQPEDLQGDQTINLFDHSDYGFELFNIRSLAGLHNSDHLNYNNTVHLLFPNISEFVNRLFLLICNETLSVDFPLISIPEFLHNNSFNYSQKFNAALHELEQSGFIEKLNPTISTKKGNSDFIRVSSSGLNKYLKVFYQDYANLRKSVIEFILGNNSADRRFILRSEIIAKTLKQSKLIVNTIIEDLASRGKITLERTHGENWEISSVQHEMFENILKRSYRASK